MEKEVLLVFKTHLDVGFTDYSKKIVDNYMDNGFLADLGGVEAG